MTTEDPDTQCALWYWSHGSVHFSLHDSEEAAARSALDLDEYDEGAPIGVQFGDGRRLRREDWPAYQDANRRDIRDAVERSRNMPPPRPYRVVRDPFEGCEVKIDADEPDWLGQA